MKIEAILREKACNIHQRSLGFFLLGRFLLSFSL
jgi:hypothetical protein